MSQGRKFGEVILSAREITLSFGAVQALIDVSVDVREHEILAIIGPNGAGKTSLLRAICGDLPLSSGQVLLNSKGLEN